MAQTNPLVALGELGQSPWYDFITRDLMASGRLAKLIANDGLLGMTSNPSIFEKAITGSADYDDDVRELSAAGKSPAEVFEALAVSDVGAACDAFLPTYERTGGRHGQVSIEVAPTLANDTEATVAEARRLWQSLRRPNAMVKIPGTRAGLPAITTCLAEGISINITLLFSVTRYEEVIDAFASGLEARLERNQPIGQLTSVASFFVSRVDLKVDAALDAMGGAAALRGKIGIANAGLAYSAFERFLQTARWKRLAAAGAAVQRPLWASTSTKDPAYPDVYYIEALIAPDTVNTIPPATFDAYRDHGQPQVRIREAMDAAPAQVAALAAAGIDLATVTEALEVEGVKKFTGAYTSVLNSLETKIAQLA